MSEENVKTFLDATAAFNRGDCESWFEFFDPEIEWHDLPTLPGAGVHRGKQALRRQVEGGGAPGIAGVYRGKEAVLGFWRDWLAAWETTDFEYELVDAGDRGVLMLDQRMRGRSSGIEALEAVGLSE